MHGCGTDRSRPEARHDQLDGFLPSISGLSSLLVDWLWARHRRMCAFQSGMCLCSFPAAERQAQQRRSLKLDFEALPVRTSMLL